MIQRQCREVEQREVATSRLGNRLDHTMSQSLEVKFRFLFQRNSRDDQDDACRPKVLWVSEIPVRDEHRRNDEQDEPCSVVLEIAVLKRTFGSGDLWYLGGAVDFRWNMHADWVWNFLWMQYFNTLDIKDRDRRVVDLRHPFKGHIQRETLRVLRRTEEACRFLVPHAKVF